MAVTLSSLTNVITNVPTDSSWGVVVIDKELFVGQYNSRTSIFVYDADTYILKRTLTTSVYIYSLGTDGIDLYIKNTSNQIVKIDKNTGTTITTNTNATYSTSNSAGFRIDLKNDRFYICDYSNKLNIYTYSTGILIKSYTLPITKYTAGVEVIENQYVIVSCYYINKVYISSIVNNDITNLSFTELYTSTSNIIGVAYYNGRLFFGTYSTNISSGVITGLVLTTTKYLIQNKTNNNIYTLDTGGNIILSPSQIIDESNYLTNGFDDIALINNTYSSKKVYGVKNSNTTNGQIFSVNIPTDMVNVSNINLE